jgi:hypothetical protein
MSPTDREAYDGLPSRFTVHRGQDASAAVGLSWTLRRSVAEDFARGHRGIRNEQPVVITRRIRKSTIAFFSDDREEKEVVLFKGGARIGDRIAQISRPNS